MVCDVCAKPLSRADTRIVTPNEMRLIANNGYGETVAVLQALPMDQRRRQFTMLTIANDTDWALCPRCWANAQPYTEAANPSGPTAAQMGAMYDSVARTTLDRMAAEEGDGLEQPWPRLSTETDGSNPLRDAMNMHLGEASFACPSCRQSMLYVEAFNHAVSPLLEHVGEWDIPSALLPHLSEVAERLAAIKTSGFHEEYAHAAVDGFECSNCYTRLSLSRAFAGQYPKAERRAPSRSPPPSYGSAPSRSYDEPKPRGGGFAMLIAAIIGGAVYYFFLR